MDADAVINVIAWTLVVSAVVNAYFVYHGGRLYFEVMPRSPVLAALWWVKTAIWLFNVFFAIVGFRYLAKIEPALPFGGIGLGIVVLFILSVPFVVHTQMARLMAQRDDRDDTRDAARDEGRDAERDPPRDLARDTERDRNGT